MKALVASLPFFDRLRNPNDNLPSGRPLPQSTRRYRPDRRTRQIGFFDNQQVQVAVRAAVPPDRIQSLFIELVIKPASNEEPIKIGTAMVCSSRPESMGIRFLKMVADDKNRLSQVILSLLVEQSLHSNFLS